MATRPGQQFAQVGRPKPLATFATLGRGFWRRDMGSRVIRASAGVSLESIGSEVPVRPGLPAENVANIVAMLTSVDGGYVTGQRVVVGGGGARQLRHRFQQVQ